MMSTIKKYWLIFSFLLTGLGKGVHYIGNKILDGARAEGYLQAEQEYDEKYNEALYDAIVYRAKYDGCCSEE